MAQIFRERTRRHGGEMCSRFSPTNARKNLLDEKPTTAWNRSMKSATLNPVLVRVTLFLALALWFLGSVPGAFAQKNLVYINGNITATGQNAVIALVNDGAGNLTPLAGSPFATGGTGVAGTGD